MNSGPPLGGSIYRGNFLSWQEAEQTQSAVDRQKAWVGLEDQISLYLRVRNGELAFVRDGVAFDRPEYPFALIAFLLRLAIQQGGKLKVIDFGGALGTTYYQTRTFLTSLSSLSWAVVELPQVVTAGQKHFTNEQLSFHLSIAEALACHGADVVLISGVLQYLAEPAKIVAEIRNLPIANILLDRIAINEADKSRTCLQLAETADGEISWPVRLFNRQHLLGLFSPDFESIIEFDSYCDPPESIDNTTILHKGFALERV